ncbi:MAG: (d)CMP kinase [SAR202 cluster bacterium]|jgi:dephospho-CoA kinase|nr:(d)CMP kinase [SAR202 cluster bacterium]
MHRIAIVGSAGTGKSTLARRLGELMGLRVIHLDALY